MDTLFFLSMRFKSPYVRLSEISEEFFGFTPKTAEQKARACALEIPTFKPRDSERAPTMVNLEDLANFYDKKYAQAQKEWQSVQSN